MHHLLAVHLPSTARLAGGTPIKTVQQHEGSCKRRRRTNHRSRRAPCPRLAEPPPSLPWSSTPSPSDAVWSSNANGGVAADLWITCIRFRKVSSHTLHNENSRNRTHLGTRTPTRLLVPQERLKRATGRDLPWNDFPNVAEVQMSVRSLTKASQPLPDRSFSGEPQTGKRR